MRHICLYYMSASGENIKLLTYFTVTALLIAAAIIDIKERRIPDILVLIGTAAGLFFSLLDPNRKFLVSLAGGAAAVLLLLLVYYTAKGGLGLGDVKLFGCIGTYLELADTVSVMLIAAVLSGIFSLVLICIKRVSKRQELPFAPFILMGVLIAVFL